MHHEAIYDYRVLFTKLWRREIVINFMKGYQVNFSIVQRAAI